VPRKDSFLTSALLSPDERPLLAAVARSPKKDEARLVYADWLEEHGGDEAPARAQFLRVQHQLRTGKPTRELRTRESELRQQLSPPWLALVGDTRERFRRWEEFAAAKAPNESWGATGLFISAEPGPLDVHYEGLWEQELLRFLASREVAPILRSLRLLGGKWSGANGVRGIDLDALARGQHEFTHLELFQVEQEGEHGMPWIGGLYGERGVLGKLLAKMPALRTFISPSAPDRTFFRVGERPVEELNVIGGDEHQDFIRNLARSSCFPRLRSLVWADPDHTYRDDWQQYCTPFEDYLELFQSPAIGRAETLDLRNVNLTPEQIRQLQALRTEGVTITPMRAG
jgi:uncharacterized protein (TIGR02996 family)